MRKKGPSMHILNLFLPVVACDWKDFERMSEDFASSSLLDADDATRQTRYPFADFDQETESFMNT